jgi:Flp pilus assembly protein TadG
VFRQLMRSFERGQAMMVFALVLPVLLGMTGMAVDLGSYANDRRDLQNAADSIALAAARDLPDATAATTSAQSWATKNGINWNQVTLSITGGDTAPKVSVDISRRHNFAFVRMVGLSGKNVGAHAAAVKASFAGGSGVVPWSVLQSAVDGATNGSVVTLKYDATGANVGNFGTIQIDGGGANIYQSDVMYGSNSAVCSATASGCTTTSCPGTYPTPCAETAPSCDGPDCIPQTGNMTGNTRDAVDFRLNYTSGTCDSFGEVFPTQDPDGTYHLSPDCNPWTSGPGSCPTPTTLCSRRVAIIPVIDDFGNGSSTPVTVQRFALVYLEGYSGTCTGNSCDIQARFVKAELTANGLAGTYDPTALIHFVKLVE